MPPNSPLAACCVHLLGLAGIQMVGVRPRCVPWPEGRKMGTLQGVFQMLWTDL